MPETTNALLYELESQKRFLQGRDSFEAFCRIYLGHHFTKVFGVAQKELISTLESMLGKGSRTVRAEPRAFGKSTLLTAFILWCVCYERKKFVVYVCDSKDQASLVVQTLQHELEENELVIKDFGDKTSRATWGKNEFLTADGIRVMARGAKSRMRGLKSFQYRPDLLVLDDLENDKNSLTIELRDELYQWFLKAALNLVSENGDAIMVGTVLHWDSVLMRVLNDKSWDAKRWAALDDQGSPTWPEGWSMAALEKKKQEIGSEAFSQEFMNDPVDNESQPFKKKFLRTYNIADMEHPEAPQRPLNAFMTWDPAWSGSKRSHFTSIVVGLVDEDNNIYIRDVFREHASETEALNQFFAFQSRYNCQRAGIEVVFRQRSLREAANEEMRKRNNFFDLVDLNSTGQKEMRVRGLVPRWEMGTIYLPEDHPKFNIMLEEFLRFPKATTDDIVDAIAYLPQVTFPPPKIHETQAIDDEAFLQDVDPESGYISSVGIDRNDLRALLSGEDKPWIQPRNDEDYA